MDLGFYAAQRELLMPVLSAAAAFLAVIVVSWPYLVRQPLAERMRGIAAERERIRRRERERLNAAEAAGTLRQEPKKLFSEIIRIFRLGDQLSAKGPRRMLRMAGYRGNAALVTFVAARFILPIVLFAVTLLYVVVLLPTESAALKMLVAIGAAGFGHYLPPILVKNRVVKRQQEIQRAWPEALDLLLICVESGMGVEAALKKVSEEIGVQSPELAAELSLTTSELSFLQDRHQAFENLGERTGLECVRSVVTSLNQAEKHGTSLGRTLRVLAQENRDTRMSLAEKKAAALPPKLTVPMILFFLPVLFAVILTPAIIQVVEVYQ